MTHEKLSQYKEKLERERGLLLEEIKQSEKPVSFGDDVDDFEEKTDEAEEIGNQLAIAQDLKKRLDEIESAISRIKNGSYGNCERCGKEIEFEILDVDPESRICKSCKA